MIKTRKTSYPPINIGTSFMLMIFIVLCMVIFATLSFSGALKDVSYSTKNADRTTAYYTASNRAERILSRIGTVLSQAEANEKQTLLEDLSVELASDSSDVAGIALTVEPLSSTDGLSVSYLVPIRDGEAIQVVLEIQDGTQLPYTVTTWKQISTLEWTGSQTLPVLGSE